MDRRIAIMIKADEHLVKPDFTFKPRLIAVVDPLVQVVVGPEVRLAAERLHKEWSMSQPIAMFHGHDVFVVFATGMTDLALGKCLDFLLENPHTIVVFVCGDDSAVFVHAAPGTFICYENDFSMYDQSQSLCVLQLEHLYLKRLGVTQEAIDWLVNCTNQTYRWNSREDNSSESISIRRIATERTFRDTGGPTTSIGNSIINAHVWLSLLKKEVFWSVNDLSTAFLKFGFKAKASVTHDWRKVGFLKGFWYRTSTGTTTWGPAPSRFLKMGKMADARCPHDHESVMKAVTEYAAGLASSYHAYAQVPLIRAFVQRFYKPGHASLGLQLERMVVGTEVQLADPVTDAAHFYGVDKAQLLEAEEMIYRSPIPTFLEHPLFLVLANRDYP